MKKIVICVGTRPNFIKVTQFEKEFANSNISYELVHTGQHFDANMSSIFFDQLNLKTPDFYLGASGKNQMEVIADIMVKFQKYIEEQQPDLVLVPGDVNSTLACALVANRNGIKIGHIESGLRSFDRSMPEEINRILVDDLTDLFFVTEQSGIDNLIKEGKSKDQINFVGNTMIDSLIAFKNDIDNSSITNDLSLDERYAVLTFHRPANVDSNENLEVLVQVINELAKDIQLVFSIHPRTISKLKTFELLKTLENNENIIILNSLGYLDFMKLVKNAKFILTDSGGIQEETTYLNIPCLTVRPNTERPITITSGSNKLISLNKDLILTEAKKIISGKGKTVTNPIALWDGNATKRIVKIIEIFLNS